MLSSPRAARRWHSLARPLFLFLRLDDACILFFNPLFLFSGFLYQLEILHFSSTLNPICPFFLKFTVMFAAFYKTETFESRIPSQNCELFVCLETRVSSCSVSIRNFEGYWTHGWNTAFPRKKISKKTSEWRMLTKWCSSDSDNILHFEYQIFSMLVWNSDQKISR